MVVVETLEVADLRFVAYNLEKNACKTKTYFLGKKQKPSTNACDSAPSSTKKN
jgi:hypothetical protein